MFGVGMVTGRFKAGRLSGAKVRRPLCVRDLDHTPRLMRVKIKNRELAFSSG